MRGPRFWSFLLIRLLAIAPIWVLLCSNIIPFANSKSILAVACRRRLNFYIIHRNPACEEQIAKNEWSIVLKIKYLSSDLELKLNDQFDQFYSQQDQTDTFDRQHPYTLLSELCHPWWHTKLPTCFAVLGDNHRNLHPAVFLELLFKLQNYYLIFK